jgi:cell division cycle protein 20 (cofactor of APC complex)
VLDAPGFANDYYLNLISWSSSNKVAIGLGDIAYVWDAEEGSVNAMGEGAEGEVPVTSVSWAGDGSYLAVGNDIGEVEIWDVDEGKKMRVMAGHNVSRPDGSVHR